MNYNARAVLVTRSSPADVVDALAACSAAASVPGKGRVEVVVTVPADSLRQAAQTALALLEQAGKVESVEVLPTAVFDTVTGSPPCPSSCR